MPASQAGDGPGQMTAFITESKDKEQSQCLWQDKNLLLPPPALPSPSS